MMDPSSNAFMQYNNYGANGGAAGGAANHHAQNNVLVGNPISRFTMQQKSNGVSDEVFDQRAERTVSISMATGRDATVSDVPGGGWYEWGTTSN